MDATRCQSAADDDGCLLTMHDRSLMAVAYPESAVVPEQGRYIIHGEGDSAHTLSSLHVLEK